MWASLLSFICFGGRTVPIGTLATMPIGPCTAMVVYTTVVCRTSNMAGCESGVGWRRVCCANPRDLILHFSKSRRSPGMRRATTGNTAVFGCVRPLCPEFGPALQVQLPFTPTHTPIRFFFPLGVCVPVYKFIAVFIRRTLADTSASTFVRILLTTLSSSSLSVILRLCALARALMSSTACRL